MEPNVPLLRKVMGHITAHPEEYDQREYAVRTDCGTTHCIAGWTLVLTGHEFTWDRLRVWDHATAADFGWNAELGTTAALIEPDAAEALGITPEQGRLLFRSSNTIADVWQIIEEITDGEIQRPPEPPEELDG